MRTEDRISGLLGMAMKAGKLKSGEFAVEKLIQSGKACLVITSEDASENTKKHFRDKCDFYEVPYAEFGTKERLGQVIGKNIRSSVALDDEGLAAAVMKLLNTQGGTKS